MMSPTLIFFRTLKPRSLKTQVSLLCTSLVGILLLMLGGLWLTQTRNSIHEEIEAASRVASQWLTALHKQALPADQTLSLVQQVGRVRANGLEVFDAGGQRLYRAPTYSYKSGRQAPEWFSQLVQPEFGNIVLPLTIYSVRLRPDPSRAILDAWDDLMAMAGWTVTLLSLLFLAVRLALKRTLQPLADVVVALNKTGHGQFTYHLPLYPTQELEQLARSFNIMNDQLAAALSDNVRLQSEQVVAAAINSHLAQERQTIARELHDELAQGITAVRALAGAIARKGRNDSTLHGAAQSILAVTGEMQQGVHAILYRLRPALAGGGLEQALENCLYLWRECHPHIRVHLEISRSAMVDLDEPRCHALLRMVQEGLTNVARHADAANVWIALEWQDNGPFLDLHDDGGGLGHTTGAGAGLGLAGLRERVELLGGQLTLGTGPKGGMRLRASFPTCTSISYCAGA